MQSPIAPFLIRILNATGAIAGAGFLVSEHHILTCAHVVETALGKKLGSLQERPNEELSFDFPLLSPSQYFRAKVVSLLPVLTVTGQPSAGEDIALLEITTGTLPSNYRVPSIVPSDVLRTTFESFGFPSGKNNGVEAKGITGVSISQDCIAIEDTKTTGYFIEQGFSGAPIYSTDSKAVIGMVVRADKEHKLAYMIPAQVLLQNCFTALTKLSAELVKELISHLEKIAASEWQPIYADCRPSRSGWAANIWMAALHLFQLSNPESGLNFIVALGLKFEAKYLNDWVTQAKKSLPPHSKSQGLDLGQFEEDILRHEIKTTKVANPYLLGKKFVGREKEQYDLTEWLTGQPETRILCICDLGGAGKSALVSYWLNRE